MDIYLENEDIGKYLSNQLEVINKMIGDLDTNWLHYEMVKKLLEEARAEIDNKIYF